jgi:ASC-1-like (ASCH) protein
MDQARTSEKKKKIKMGKILQFPLHRIKRAVPEVTISDEQKQHFKEEQFIEQLTEQLSLDVLEVLKENVVDINNDVFLRDLAITIESIKSLLKRDFNKPHPMQKITDTLVNILTTPDNKKLTEINYSKIVRTVKAVVNPPKPKEKQEKTVDVDFEFDLE